MTVSPLTDDELSAALEQHPAWSVVDGKLTHTRKLTTFHEAINFVRAVARVAEELNHHPDIDIRWRDVKLAVCTHDAHNAITKFDLRLAERVDAL
jgi:4a-hydroxytetrahydrobiopterin dehydratase